MEEKEVKEEEEGKGKEEIRFENPHQNPAKKVPENAGDI
jgi:hypothetical protein